MQKLASPKHRDLSHINARAFEAVNLSGKILRPASKDSGTLGRWDNLMNKTQNRDRRSQPASPSKRQIESSKASRTLHPQLNEEKWKTPSKKILGHELTSGCPGSWSSLMQKTADTKDSTRTEKRLFADRFIPKKEDTTSGVRRLLKFHPDKIHDWGSHIAALPSSTQQEEISRTRSPSRKRFLDTSTEIISQRIEAEKPLPIVQREEKETKTQLIRDLNMTVFTEPYLKQTSSIERRDHNVQSHVSYQDESRLNPNAKGKRNFSLTRDEESVNVSDLLQRIHPLTSGKKMSVKRSTSPGVFYDSTAEEAPQPNSGRARALYSFRTFASQVFG